MKCPYCGHDMGDLPVVAIRASMQGHRMLQIFDELVRAGDPGISLIDLVNKIYGPSYRSDAFNALKVTMIRLKERVAKHGWTIESSTAVDSATEKVYRIKRGGNSD